jgi:ribosomal subunit interface protein
MKILISGKHVNVGESLQAHIEHRLEEGVKKYLDRVTSVNVVIAKEAHLFRVDIHGHTGTSSGLAIKSSATAEDVYPCFDAAADKIEKQLRRYKRRLTNHHKNGGGHVDDAALHPQAQAKKYVLKPDDETQEHSESPVIIAEKSTAIEKLTVGEAVMKMDLADLPALLFFNSASGRINVVYRRVDGNISWVDPEEKAA